jgi:calcium binding protein 39
MAFLFKPKQKTPAELVRTTQEAIQKLEQGDGRRTNEEISKNLSQIKNILYGDGGFLD